MAKKPPSKHSRAARKATSPSIDTDKSLKNVKPPEESIDQRPAVLAARHSAGVTKKSKAGRKAVMSSRARRRHEKGMDRAEAVLNRTAAKIEKSRGQARTVQGRRKAWEDINSTVTGADKKRKKSARELAAEAEQEAVDKFFREDGDEEMDDEGDVAVAETGASAAAPVAQPADKIPLEDDDEIL